VRTRLCSIKVRMTEQGLGCKKDTMDSQLPHFDDMNKPEERLQAVGEYKQACVCQTSRRHLGNPVRFLLLIIAFR
jgi:hypothetical protein